MIILHFFLFVTIPYIEGNNDVTTTYPFSGSFWGCLTRHESVEKVNMTFYIFLNGTTVPQPEAYIWNDRGKSTQGTFPKTYCDPKKTTVIIVSGFTTTIMLDDHFRTMRQELLKRKEVGCVIYASWTNASRKNYFREAANTIVAGEIIADFTSLTKIPLDNLRMVGHSLGAHVIGFAGRFLKGKVARCTGLDPAAPCFEYNSPLYRLSEDDCKFVDVIHTDGGFLGDRKQIGCSDYYPNGGLKQPNCGITDFKSYTNPITKKTYLQECSHQKANVLYSESINSECQFIGVLSGETWDDFKDNKGLPVGSPEPNKPSLPFAPKSYFAVMGYHAVQLYNVCKSEPHFRLYLFTTGKTNSLCVYQYIVTVEVASKTTIRDSEKAFGHLALYDLTGGILKVYQKADNTKDIELESGKTNNYISFSQTKFNPGEKLQAIWISDEKKPPIVFISSILITIVNPEETIPWYYTFDDCTQNGVEMKQSEGMVKGENCSFIFSSPTLLKS